MLKLKKSEEDELADYDKIRLKNIRERLELFQQVFIMKPDGERYILTFQTIQVVQIQV
jgi:hypothetical protein